MSYPTLSPLEACLIAFQADCPNPTTADVAAWSTKFPDFADDIHETAVAMRFLVPIDDVEIPVFSDEDLAKTDAFGKMMAAMAKIDLKKPYPRS
jgi:hypothetical protein